MLEHGRTDIFAQTRQERTVSIWTTTYSTFGTYRQMSSWFICVQTVCTNLFQTFSTPSICIFGRQRWRRCTSQSSRTLHSGWSSYGFTQVQNSHCSITDCHFWRTRWSHAQPRSHEGLWHRPTLKTVWSTSAFPCGWAIDPFLGTYLHRYKFFFSASWPLSYLQHQTRNTARLQSRSNSMGMLCRSDLRRYCQCGELGLDGSINHGFRRRLLRSLSLPKCTWCSKIPSQHWQVSWHPDSCGTDSEHEQNSGDFQDHRAAGQCSQQTISSEDQRWCLSLHTMSTGSCPHSFGQAVCVSGSDHELHQLFHAHCQTQDQGRHKGHTPTLQMAFCQTGSFTISEASSLVSMHFSLYHIRTSYYRFGPHDPANAWPNIHAAHQKNI